MSIIKFYSIHGFFICLNKIKHENITKKEGANL